MQYPELNQKLDAIEAELRRLNFLVGPVDKTEGVSSAFGYGQMSFEQWLGQVFLPNVRRAVASGDIPSQSQVGVAAVRNFDGNDQAEELVSLLCDFDQTVERFAATSKRQAESQKPSWFRRFFGLMSGREHR